MSFTKLLATGKSLIGMKDQNSPYRMRRKNLLPKFESAKNPFAQPAKADSAKSAPCAIEMNLLFEAQPKPAAAAMVEEAPVKVVKELAPAPVPPLAMKIAPKPASPSVDLSAVKSAAVPAVVPAATPAPFKLPAAKSAVFPSWMKKANPLAYLLSRNGGDTAHSKAGRPPVQTELSLEKVKVVRNDLNDTDLAVIAVPMGGRTSTKPQTPALERTGSNTLNRLSARLFGAGHPQV